MPSTWNCYPLKATPESKTCSPLLRRKMKGYCIVDALICSDHWNHCFIGFTTNIGSLCLLHCLSKHYWYLTKNCFSKNLLILKFTGFCWQKCHRCILSAQEPYRATASLILHTPATREKGTCHTCQKYVGLWALCHSNNWKSHNQRSP